ncbi:autotransporter outer membrane beta-barrel domain-containing protein [Bosea sp. BK604]|uniref:autotransporter outer membrane beta-barrel domain-containing protein n=1 Tax=Bosea sp. BK604 TaxID=2512180 RepID=UPI0010D673D2|nr:autotransporter outer membrane beta-barrel domain-containing protein [Bosea sp. BK604]TCR68186.1 outer membrane autotransporter protein [Bosea sp. BK604]
MYRLNGRVKPTCPVFPSELNISIDTADVSRPGQLSASGGLAVASYTWHEIETSRIVAFPGFGNSLRADYNAGTAQVFGELGYRIDLGRVALEPFAGLACVNLHSENRTAPPAFRLGPQTYSHVGNLARAEITQVKDSSPSRSQFDFV